MGATNTVTNLFPILVFFFYLFAIAIAANEPGPPDQDPTSGSNGDNDDGLSKDEPTKGRPSPFEELVADRNQGTISSRYGRTHEIDEDEATIILVARLEDIRNTQCSACIDGLRFYTEAGGLHMMDSLKETYQQRIRQIEGMRPVIEPIINRYSHLQGEVMPLHHAVRECTVVHRAYLETLVENQIRSVQPGSPDDIFYGFSERLPDPIRLSALEEHLAWIKTIDSLDWTSCLPQDAFFTDGSK